MLCLRLAFAAFIPLTQDEAYYRLWAQHPALGYYDHPPMVAWAQAAGMRLLGDTPLGARLFAVLASGATTLLVFDLARCTGLGDATARRGALWYAAAPLMGVGAVLALPDVFASLFWALCLRGLLAADPTGHRDRPGRAMQAARIAPWTMTPWTLAPWTLGPWTLVGAAAGLAFLSKYSALFLGPAVVVWLGRTPQGRASFRTPGPWLAAGVAAAIGGLNIAWNAQHHWATFAKQFGRVAPEGFAPIHLLLFLLAFAGLFNPLTLPFLARPGAGANGLIARIFGPRGLGPRVQAEPSAPLDLLWISGAPFLAYLVAHSLHAAVQAHWPAPTYAALTILAAAGAQGCRGGWRWLARLAPVAGLAMSTAALAHLALPVTDWRGHSDPARDLRGWREFAQRLDQVRQASGARWVGMLSYGDAAQLAADWPGPAPVLQVSERRRYVFAPPPAGVEGPGIVADLPRRMSLKHLSDCFAVVRPLPDVWRGDTTGRTGADYALAWVDQPRRDVARVGCRTFHNGKVDP